MNRPQKNDPPHPSCFVAPTITFLNGIHGIMSISSITTIIFKQGGSLAGQIIRAVNQTPRLVTVAAVMTVETNQTMVFTESTVSLDHGSALVMKDSSMLTFDHCTVTCEVDTCSIMGTIGKPVIDKSSHQLVQQQTGASTLRLLHKSELLSTIPESMNMTGSLYIDLTSHIELRSAVFSGMVYGSGVWDIHDGTTIYSILDGEPPVVNQSSIPPSLQVRIMNLEPFTKVVVRSPLWNNVNTLMMRFIHVAFHVSTPTIYLHVP
jgi:hypothetical protein